ncbi:MAG TPA: BTAD domain-containing putative transcriptional regulator, partial [Trueperaceae bacterium]|nr:BTAD domain-containing putative transcriptional regulator [Trueperaceae bacterium]
MEPRLLLLGSPLLETGAGTRDLPVDKPASLLYYLVMRADWVSRSELAYLYRPDAPEEVALGNVRVLLHRAKFTVTPTRLEVEKARVRCLIATDAAAFQSLAKAGDASALQLFRGPFLSGMQVSGSPGYDTWLELERSRLSQLWRRATLHEVARLEQSGELQRAADLTASLIAAEPLDEEAVQAHLRLLASLGRLGEARAAYEELSSTLAAEVGGEPLVSTRDLFLALTTATLAGEQDPAAPRPTLDNLPVQTTRFIGRQREVAAVVELLDRHDTRLVTITGLGGVGKSRLSLEAATRRLAAHVDGVWFVELAGTTAPESLPTAIATALRLDLSGAATRGAMGILIDHLRDKQSLLVLDNFEHLVSAAALLEELLSAAQGLVILATSRVALSLRAETIFELGGLSVPPAGTTDDLTSFDAVKLFVERAEHLSASFVGSGRTLEAVATLARKVEGLPLALELAATWTRSLTAPELVAALDGNLDLLAASLRDLPERQRSIREVLAYSWKLLTTSEQRALERLSVFRGGFTQAAANEVAGVHLALLLGLMSHSLLGRMRGGRFHLHELVRLFAAERLAATAAEQEVDVDPATPASLGEAHSRYFLLLLTREDAELRTTRRAAVLDGLFQELDNIRLALANAVERFDEEQLCAALPSLFTLYLESGSLTEITAQLEGLAAAVHNAGRGQGRLALLVGQQLGRAHMAGGDFARALAELGPVAEALRAVPEGRTLEGLPRVLDWLGSCARIVGDLESAEGYVVEAMALAEGQRGSGTERLRADVTYNLASLRQAQGRHSEALALLEQSLESSLRSRDDVGAAMRRLALAKILIVTGADLAAARRNLEEALSVGRATRATRVEGAALNALAVLAGQQDDQAGAERYNLESL